MEDHVGCDESFDLPDDLPDDLCDWLLEMEEDTKRSSGARAPHTTCDDGEGEFMPTAHEHAVGEAGWVEAASNSLHHNGFCVLRHRSASEPCISPHTCEPCANAAVNRLTRLLAAARCLGISPRRDVFRCARASMYGTMRC